jgi:hypothetical protein
VWDQKEMRKREGGWRVKTGVGLWEKIVFLASIYMR